MAYCSNCGQEVKDGVKFCNNCGAPVNAETAMNAAEQSEPAGGSRILDTRYPDYRRKTRKSMLTGLFGIGLLILAIVAFFSDPPVLTMALGFIIVAGAIICLVKKCRLKGFTIAALVIASFCIFAAIIQGTDAGWFSKSYNKGTSTGNYASSKGTSSGSSNSSSASSNYSTAKDEKKDTPIIGVDPDLKAFLDSYEAFIDEYVDFMHKYMKDPMNALSMMTEYNDMSTADSAYYLEVTTRCTMKMMEIYK